MKKIKLLVLFVFVNNLSINQLSAQTKQKEEKLYDVAYGAYPSNTMDVVLPVNRNPKTPLVIIIHGGGWQYGDKSDPRQREIQDSMLVHGIATVNINYRFIDSLNVHCAQIMQDVDNAVNYCIENSKKWNTRKNNFVVFGTSAGAHISLLYGYENRDKIGSIISECGPTNFTDLQLLDNISKNNKLSLLNMLTDDTYIQGKPLPLGFKKYSPVTKVTKVPTLIIHGTADDMVPYSQALDLEKVLKFKKVTYKLVSLKDADHNLNINVPKTKALIYKEAIDWALKYGK